MKFYKTMMMTAAAVILSSAAAMAEGNTSRSDSTPAEPTAGANYSSDTSVSVGASVDKSTIKQVQAGLANEGYTVAQDGVWGPKTAAVLRDFQQDKGLPATGTINNETLAALSIH